MATYTFSYTSGTDVTSSWTNIANLWDTSGITYTNRTIPASGVDDSANHILCQGTDYSAPTTSTYITKVEVYIRQARTGATTNVKCYPLFNGGTSSGTLISFAAASSNTVTYTDITSTSGAPSTWTWSDIENMDLKIWGECPGTSYDLRYYRVGYRITYYNALAYRYNNTTNYVRVNVEPGDCFAWIGAQNNNTSDYYIMLEQVSSGTTPLHISMDTDLLNHTTGVQTTYTIKAFAGSGDVNSYQHCYNATTSNEAAANNVMYVQKFTTTASGYVSRYGREGQALLNGEIHKVCLFDSSGNLLKVWGPYTQPGKSWGWHPGTFNSYFLSISTVYYAGIIFDPDHKGTMYYDSSAGSGGKVANNYANPTSFSVGSLTNTDRRYNMTFWYKWKK